MSKVTTYTEDKTVTCAVTVPASSLDLTMSAFSLGKQVVSAFNREKPNVSFHLIGI